MIGSVTSMGEEKTAELARFPIFESLSADELRQVADLAVPRRYEAGEVIFREGDRPDTCFIVRSGRVRITRRHSGGRILTLAELSAGEMFGELSMFDGEGRSATVEALEDTTTLALLERDVRRVLREHPEIAVKMLARLASRLRAANENLARQSFQPVAGRVASTLLAQVEARRAEAAAAVDAGGSDRRIPADEIVIEATQADIAQLAGSSRESASRFLADLERAGVVTTARGRIVVHDPEALRRYIF
ncbi:MAG: Crp/Fnr family transcriptional regulator [Thermoleophilaceae bacterium]|nr:Crp/Fnr family transcriptional regulator [Thermoleophilaceae bacterium]